MEIYYLSDGEYPARMDFADLESNLRISYHNAIPKRFAQETGYNDLDDLIDDMAGALDGQGFWHGTLTCYNVAIVRVDKIKKLDLEYDERAGDS